MAATYTVMLFSMRDLSMLIPGTGSLRKLFNSFCSRCWPKRFKKTTPEAHEFMRHKRASSELTDILADSVVSKEKTIGHLLGLDKPKMS